MSYEWDMSKGELLNRVGAEPLDRHNQAGSGWCAGTNLYGQVILYFMITVSANRIVQIVRSLQKEM